MEGVVMKVINDNMKKQRH